jgi:hypothetical protein
MKSRSQKAEFRSQNPESRIREKKIFESGSQPYYSEF